MAENDQIKRSDALRNAPIEVLEKARESVQRVAKQRHDDARRAQNDLCAINAEIARRDAEAHDPEPEKPRRLPFGWWIAPAFPLSGALWLGIFKLIGVM